MKELFKNKTVLVTGGTKGIGLACVKAFSGMGAKVYGTYLWGDNLDQLEQDFSSHICPPTFIQADASDERQSEALITSISQEFRSIDILISNVAFAPQFKETYQYRELEASIQHNAWPLITYLELIKKAFSHHPKHVVALTSEGHRSCHLDRYDYVAASKAVLESLVKYISAREEIIVNCISPGVVDTEAFDLVFGKNAQAFLKKHDPDFVIPAEDVANVAVALCSGLMDAVRGQIIKVDKGKMFTDTFLKWFNALDT